VKEGRRELLRDVVNQSLMSGSEPGWPGASTWPCGVSASHLVEIVFEHMMQMAEGFLLGHDGDVILARVGDELRDVGGRAPPRRRGQRVIGIEERVLEIWRVDVGLVGRRRGSDASGIRAWERAAGEIVLMPRYFMAGQSRIVPVGSTRGAPGSGSNCLNVCTP
jgi:hypothetical protein